jgi:16S rRNA (guanine966-N2)-methyltransferase
VRIIAGSAKGTRLVGVPPGVRPMSDRAREGLFSSLGADLLKDARVLDLYAGTGAAGIEALSRGAREATFVDASATSITAIRKNLERTHLADRAVLRRSDVHRFVTVTSNPDRVAVCLLDPPYDTPARVIEAVLASVDRSWLAGDAWTVALTRPKRSSTFVIPVDWRVARRLEYGDSLVICYRED